jgi:hypothetical protein
MNNGVYALPGFMPPAATNKREDCIRANEDGSIKLCVYCGLPGSKVYYSLGVPGWDFGFIQDVQYYIDNDYPEEIINRVRDCGVTLAEMTELLSDVIVPVVDINGWPIPITEIPLENKAYWVLDIPKFILPPGDTRVQISAAGRVVKYTIHRPTFTIHSALQTGCQSGTGAGNTALADMVAEHANDTSLHLTDGERETWNGRLTSLEQNITISEDNSIVIGRVGSVDGANSIVLGYESYTTGDNSIAIGHDISSGLSATALGYDNEAGAYSTALGCHNEVPSTYSIALGCYNKVPSNGSTTLGYYNTASGYQSIALGHHSKGVGAYSTALGYFSSATVQSSTAVGYYSEASGQSSTAVGSYSRVTGYESIALGYENKTMGDCSTTLGDSNEVTSDCSTALGSSNKVTGYYSTALGYANEANGYCSVAVGNRSHASGYNSIAIGSEAYSNDNSIALGQYASANAASSTALGISARTYKEGSLVISATNSERGTSVSLELVAGMATGGDGDMFSDNKFVTDTDVKLTVRDNLTGKEHRVSVSLSRLMQHLVQDLQGVSEFGTDPGSYGYYYY